MALGAILLPAGLLTYGWTAQAHTHWIWPDIGIGFVAAGILVGSQAIRMYATDAFGTYTASATGAISLLRAIGGFTFPLFAP